MKITNIKLAQPFKNNRFTSRNTNSINIQISEANTDGRWFYDDCKRPSYKVYLDEVKPQINKPNIEFEYYDMTRNEDGEDILTPITGTIARQNGKVTVIDGDSQYDFSGISYKKENGELIQEVRHMKGYPFYVTEYKDGEEYKLIHYSHHAHKINQIYYYDGSFELSQKSNPDNVTIELQMLNANKEKMAVQINATKEGNGKGSAICCIPDEDGHKTISLNWTYPVIKYSFYGNSKDAKSLQSALIELKKVINDEKYKSDFGSCSYLNRELKDAIEYLEVMKTNTI